jgi:hypothetical protein
MKPVETKLKLHDKVDHQRSTDADGKTYDINERERLVSLQVPDRYGKIILEHSRHN